MQRSQNTRMRWLRSGAANYVQLRPGRNQNKWNFDHPKAKKRPLHNSNLCSRIFIRCSRRFALIGPRLGTSVGAAVCKSHYGWTSFRRDARSDTGCCKNRTHLRLYSRLSNPVRLRCYECPASANVLLGARSRPTHRLLGIGQPVFDDLDPRHGQLGHDELILEFGCPVERVLCTGKPFAWVRMNQHLA